MSESSHQSQGYTEASRRVLLWRTAWNFSHCLAVFGRAMVVCWPAAVAATAGNLVLFSDQGMEFLREYAVGFRENALWRSDAPSTWWLYAAVSAWTLGTWYCARRLLMQGFQITPSIVGTPAGNFGHLVRQFFPTVLGLACIVPIASAIATILDIDTQIAFVHRPRLYFGLLLGAAFMIAAVLNRHCLPRWFSWLVVALGLGATIISMAVIAQSVVDEYRFRDPTPTYWWVRPFIAFVICLAGIFLTARILLADHAIDRREQRTQTAKLVAALVLIVAGAAVFAFTARWPDELGLIFCLFATGLYVFIGWRGAFSLKWLGWSSPRLSTVSDSAAHMLPRLTILIFLLTTVSIFVFGYFIVKDPVVIGETLHAIPIVLVALVALTVLISFPLVLLPRTVGSPLVMVLAIVAVWWTATHVDNHPLLEVVPHSETLNAALVRSDLKSHFLEWKTRRSLGQDDPVFIVAAAGGGLRAAVWTALTLSVLDDNTCGEFGRHLYAISSVSGGSLGAAAYVAARHELGEEDCVYEEMFRERTQLLKQFFANDFLSPPLANMLFPDLAQRFSLVEWLSRDRGWALERSWQVYWQRAFPGDSFSEPFLSLYAGSGLYELPLLFFNATSVEDGKRVIAGPVRAEFFDSFDLLEHDLITGNLKLSTAVHNSARFTYVSPAGLVRKLTDSGREKIRRSLPLTKMDTMSWGRLVDGGYFENSGGATARELVDMIADAQGGRRDNLYAIVISNAPREREERICQKRLTRRGLEFVERKSARKKLPGEQPSFAESISPPRALMATREARGSYSERDVVRAVGGCAHVFEVYLANVVQPRTTRSGRVLSYESIGGTTDPPLGWFLSHLSYAAIESALEKELFEDMQPVQLELERVAARALNATYAGRLAGASAKWLKDRRIEFLCKEGSILDCPEAP